MAKTQLLMQRATLDDLPPTPALPVGYDLVTCTPTDNAALSRLLSAAFDDPTWTAERVDSALLKADDVLETFAVTCGSELVASASLRALPEQFPGSAYLHWVGADPAHRGKHLGAIVSVAVLHAGRGRGFGTAWLETDDFRLAAIKTYLDMDFVPVLRDETHDQRWADILPKVVKQ